MIDQRYIKNYHDFSDSLGKSTDITPFQLKIGKSVTLTDGRTGVISGVCSTPDKVKVKINESGKVEDIKISDFI